ncbi:MAG: hypothetical protein O9248_00150 [Rhodobacteraceae bacterium]|nr:hypothetical protein [Paracoccaceae bacterium]
MPDPNVLFPSDAPAQAPEWFKARQSEAEARLMGRHDAHSAQANALFPSDAKGHAPAPQRPAAPQAKPNDPTAAALFPSEGQKTERMSDEGFKDAAPYEGAKALGGFFDGFAGSAIAEGDTDRAEELQAAGAALTKDFASAGTDPAELADALSIVRERHADTAFGPVSEEKLVADYNATMSSLAEEGVSIADIDAARAFIADLELVAPGTMQTLEATGAGNDARLIRKAIAEARRRGY